MVALAWTFSLMTLAGSPCDQSAWQCVQANWFADLNADLTVDLSTERAELPAVEAAQELPWMLLWRGQETEWPDQPRWIKHKVLSRERLSQIAIRYGVTVEQVKEWNKIKGSQAKRGKSLRIRAKRLPPAQELLKHTVKEGETWGSIGAAYRDNTISNNTAGTVLSAGGANMLGNSCNGATTCP